MWVTGVFLHEQFCGTKCSKEAAEDGCVALLSSGQCQSELRVSGWATEPIVMAETQMGSPCPP